MATFPEIGSGTLTVRNRILSERTSPGPDPTRDEEDVQPLSGDKTVSSVNRLERGDQKITDQHATSDQTAALGDAEEAATVRQAVAAKASKALTRVQASYGTSKMAVDLELLKRELSRCHDAIGPLPSESNYLSMVTLVESELGTKPWRAISKEELAALRKVIDAGIEELKITYDHFYNALRALNASGWTTAPPVELGEIGEALQE